jgi:hypothetical protein
MGMSSSSSKSTTNQTTTPVVSEPYNSAFSGFTNNISDFLATDPHQYVAPTSPLQQQAFDQAAAGLGAGTPHIDTASGYAAGAADAPASSVDFSGYTAPKLGNAATFGGATLDGPTLYGGADLGDPTQILQYMQDYQNPYTQQVIDASLADYDQYAGHQRASMAADAAKTQAFGGSRYGIAQGQLEGELARGRASTVATLLDQQYRLAAELAGRDATTANQFTLTQGGYDQQAGLTNQGALNNFAIQQALLNQQAGMANAAARNQFALSQFGANTDAAQFGANAANQESATNANLLEQQYQRALQAAGLEGGLASTAGTQELADLAATAGLGDTQRSITQADLNAVPTQLQLAGQLYGDIAPAVYAGQNLTGTTKTTSSPAWGPMIIGSGLQAAGSMMQGAIKF